MNAWTKRKLNIKGRKKERLSSAGAVRRMSHIKNAKGIFLRAKRKRSRNVKKNISDRKSFSPSSSPSW
jgi:hypothetical protein